MIRRSGTLSLIALTLFCCCGYTAPQSCKEEPEPSHLGAEVAGVAIVTGVIVGTIVAVHVHNSHHTVKGCVVTGPNGPEIRADNGSKTWTLSGLTPDQTARLKPGDEVRVHGSRVKQPKGATTDPVFAVQKFNKDYGACKTPATS